jgi:bifunctional DNA-binding transcriptional regulator/antitoxin component of YhaV-PrlF toxin-antitoxin module
MEITTTLQPRGPAGAIVLDDEQVAAIGGGAKAFPVKVTVNGTPVDLRLARMGGENLIGFRKELRRQLGIEIGDAIHAVIERDDAPRAIAIPDELQQALDANPEAKAAFEQLAPTHRKEHARSVAEAKRPETRAKRVEAVLRAVMQT